MSDRWYSRPGKNADIIPVSRIRLLRNFKGYPFPASMSAEEQKKLFQDVEKKIREFREEVAAWRRMARRAGSA